jgi:NADPH:quinone reductase-like Zn-dependent oxidoreductase
MKAVLVGKNKELLWSEVPNPVLAEDEVLVKVEYAALNRADLMQRDGDYPPPPGCPEWMGLEVSGEIVEMTEGAKVVTDITVSENAVRVKRVGAVSSDMLFEEGLVHSSVYTVSPYSFDVDVTTKKIRNNLTRDSGRLDIHYSMKIGGADKSVRMKIEY